MGHTTTPADADTNVQVACTLTARDADRQLLEWVDLRHRASAIAEIDGGMRLTFPAALERGIRDLAAREAQCCTFLTIRVHVDEQNDTVTVELTSPEPAALVVIEALAGRAGA